MYQEYLPGRMLASYIDRYWEFNGQPGCGMRINILPDGCTDFIFTLGEAVKVLNDNLQMKPYHSYFVGPMQIYSELITCSDTVHMFGIRFLPCGISRFMKLPLDELANIRVSTDDLDCIFEDSFAERLSEKQSSRERIDLIENFLVKCLYSYDQEADRQIMLAVHLINRFKGNLPVNKLTDEICLCRRHFERKFKIHTGFTPKKYSSIVKFRNAIEILRNTPFDNLLSVAVKAGYYDAAHFSREVKNLSGSTLYSFLSLPSGKEASFLYME